MKSYKAFFLSFVILLISVATSDPVEERTQRYMFVASYDGDFRYADVLEIARLCDVRIIEESKFNDHEVFVVELKDSPICMKHFIMN
jgi:hypothetical protein